MKKGFTLVELLAVIVILSVISIIVFPNVIRIINQSRENVYQTQLRQLETIAKDFATDHPELLDANHLNDVYVPIDTLKSSSYLEVDKTSNPKTGEEMHGCIKITFNDDTNQYHYAYEEEDCTTNQTLSGYVILYENGLKAEKRNELISVYDKIVSDYQNIISTIGGVTSGLYDVEDEYVFRGNPNNYVKLGSGGDSYRIISMNKKNKTIKLIKVTPESSAYTDTNSNVFIESSIATYLLSFLNSGSLKNFASKVAEETKWKNGKLDITSAMNYDVLKSVEGTSTVSNRLGLIQISEYALASLSNDCYQNVYNSACRNDNYLATLFGNNYVWTMSSSTPGHVITIEGGVITDHAISANDATYRIYPVVVLKNSLAVVSGNGTSSTPYVLN